MSTPLGRTLRNAGASIKRAQAKARRALLMPHEERLALIRKPFPITYIPPVKRWGGVQLINDEDWMRDANAWRKKYADQTTQIDWEAEV